MIVVLVILAILAAMMVPALLGWIDEARNKQYVLEARSVYMAMQAVADEAYAKQGAKLTASDLKDAKSKIEKLSDVSLGTDDSWLTGCSIPDGAADYSTDAFKIVALRIKFLSGAGKADGDKKPVFATLDKDEWKVSFEKAETEALSGEDICKR